ncbi:MAG: hypothetical protein Q9195_006261 [Heterodermia aff. obscurata]
MAAASADAPYDGHHDSEYLDRKTLPLRTGLHDSRCLFTETQWRCDTSCMQRDPTGETFTPISSLVQFRHCIPCENKYANGLQFLELTFLDSHSTLEAPPSYLESTSDIPPAYADVDLPALFEDLNCVVPAKREEQLQRFQPSCNPGLPLYQDLFNSMTTPPINFDDTSNIRQSKGGKKASKAQKQASKNNWESGDEDNKYGGGGTDDNWGGVSTGKKGKKSKKDKTLDPTPDPAANNPSIGTFDDINLGDSPQLNLSFGDTGTKDTGNGFDFGSWGGSWGNTTNKWDFSAADTGNTDITDHSKDTKDTSLDGGEGGIWSFGSNKKNKKKTTTTGFDFAMGAVDEGKEDETSKIAETDSWGTFAPAGGKAKKDKKKSVFEDIGIEPGLSGIGTALEEPTAAGEDSWTAWGTASAKKDKKKGKKATGEEIAPISPLPPVAPKEVSPDDDWGAFNTKKNKKKSKTANVEEHIDESSGMADPVLEPEAGNGWESLNGKKDKKKGKKTLVEEQHQETETGEKETDVGADFGWDSFDTAKKNKKKVNANPFGMQVAESIVEKNLDPANDLSFDFGSKKGKKGKKGATEDSTKIEPAVTVVPEIDFGVDDDLGVSGPKKDKKKGKKGTAEDATKLDKVNFSQAPDSEPFDDYGWGSTTKNDKKGKKDLFSEGREDTLVSAGHEADAHTVGIDDDWVSGWGSTDKKGKKGKKTSTAIEAQKLDKVAPPPPPPPPTEPEPSTFDSWGTATKAKKGKKGNIVAVPDQPEENVDPFDVDFGGWGLSAKDKKKKEKEREKEKKDIEAREEAEREEKEKEEKEQAEQEEKESAERDKAKLKTKPGKKGKATTTETSKTKDLMADSVPDFAPAAVEDVPWGMWAGSAKKDKTKSGKNALPGVPPPVPTPPAQGLTPEPELIPGLDDVGDDDWASFAAPAKSKGKRDGNTASKSTKAGEAKTAKKPSKDKAEYSPTEPSKDDLKKKESPNDESVAKATKGFWGVPGTTPTAKSKMSKAKDAEKPKDLVGLDDLLDEEVMGTIEEPAATSTKKGFKVKGDNKLGSKDGGTKKSSDDALLEDLLDVGDEQLASVMDEAEGKKDDAWGFWGGSKKTGGKKADELPKEITKPVGANQKGSLKNNFNQVKKEKEPESAATPADEASQSQPSKASKRSTMSAPKPTTKSSVLQRVKDLEKEKDKGSGKAKEKPAEDTAEPQPQPQPPAPEIVLEPLSKAEPAPPKKSTATGSRFKGGKTDSKKKAPSPPAAQEKDISAVPGSFPGEALDDDLLDLLGAPPVEKKPARKPVKSKQEPEQESVMDMMDDFNFDAPPAELLPTPPPEPVAAKPAKKERARVVKNEGASSWGFWGATPKKEAKKDVSSKDDAELPPPKPKEKKPAPGLSRSKSTKTAKEKDKEMEKSSRSSGSDEKDKKSEPRPSKSRGSSFGGFFGGPPPVRAKTVRRNSTAASKTASSRRPSIDVDAIGLPSPPAGEAPEMSSKAATLMGTAKVDRKATTRGKQKAKGSANSDRVSEDRKADINAVVVPDPYAIDDDDMVVVGGYDGPTLEDAPRQEPPARAKKEKPSKSNSKKEVSAIRQSCVESTPSVGEKSEARIVQSKVKRANHGTLQTKSSPEVADDVVMVEAGSPKDDLDGGPKEHLAFDERPRPQRSITSARKPKGSVMGGLFGFGKSRRASETFERPKSKGVVTDDEGIARRKRPVAGGGDSAKRLRRDDRKVRRSDREDRAAEGYVYDLPADGGAVTGAEDDEIRRERNANRAAARETDLKDVDDDHRARRRDAERAAEDTRKLKAKADRRARKEEEAEALRLEEKRARRAARAEMNAKLAAAEPSPRPTKSERRRSHIDQPMQFGATDDTERRVRREARRAARTPGEKSNRRKTTAPVDDYFDPRNGVNGQEPYLHGANDHTSSWVKSQISDPAPPPPVEGTVIEPTPVLGGAHDAAIEEDAARRSKRKSRRQSRYVEMTPEEEEARRRRKDREIRSSEESRDDDGGRPYTSRRKSDFVGGMRGFDARPSLAANGKRGSWLKRVSGF